MKILSLSLFTGLLLASINVGSPGHARAETEYNEASQTVTHDCGRDPDVSITSASNTVTLTGACARVAVVGASNNVTIESVKKLAISGSSNEVHVVAADKIAVTGSANQVTWKKGLSGKKPKVSSVGVQNKIRNVK